MTETYINIDNFENKNYLINSSDLYENLLEEKIDTDNRILELDNFLIRTYKYYTNKGLYSSIFLQISNLLTFGFIILFFSFLICGIDYDNLFKKHILSKALTFSFPRWYIFLFGPFCIYWLYQCIQLYFIITTNLEIHNFYKNRLAINDSKLLTIHWDDVIERIINVPNLCIIKQLESIDINQRILRKQNYLIAMMNNGILNLPLMSMFIEKTIYITIFGFVFDDSNVLRSEITNSLEKVDLDVIQRFKKRCRLYGIIFIFISPFLFILYFMFIFFKYGEIIRNKPSELGNRYWSSLAKWKFKKLCEMPHQLKERLDKAVEPANRYLENFPSNPIYNICLEFISFVAGSIILVLILFTIYDDQILIHLELFGEKNVLWFIGILGIILTICRSQMNSVNNDIDKSIEEMENVIQLIEYQPNHWVRNYNSHQVKNEFSNLFEYRFVTFLKEILSILYIPYILIFYLPSKAEKIITFFKDYSTNIDGLGYIYNYTID